MAEGVPANAGAGGAGAGVEEAALCRDGEAKVDLYDVDGVAAVKDATAFRQYDGEDQQGAIVRNHYKCMRQNQSVEFVDRMWAKWHTFDKAELTIREAFDELNDYADSSDPDTTLPNVVHAFQTAESARAAGEPDWLVLTALIHDMGKIMFKWGRPEDGQQGTITGPQWALGGDTWVVGVPIPDTVVLPEFNTLNPDHGKFEGPCGMYEPGCGFANLKFAYGHDEYMYQLLKFNKCSLPAEALAIVRYHSCYPWHSQGCYQELQASGDEKLKEMVIRFNKYDLYTKSPVAPDMKALWPYYQRLIDKYCPGKLKW